MFLLPNISKNELKNSIVKTLFLQSLVDIFDEPELEEELKQLKEQDEKEKQINLDIIDIKTGELRPMTTNSNKYIAILQELLDNKLEVLL